MLFRRFALLGAVMAIVFTLTLVQQPVAKAFTPDHDAAMDQMYVVLVTLPGGERTDAVAAIDALPDYQHLAVCRTIAAFPEDMDPRLLAATVDELLYGAPAE